MFTHVFKKPGSPPPFPADDKGFVHVPFEPSRLEARETERLYARLFSTDDGRRVLSHLQAITFGRALGPASSDSQLRYVEGQRAMVATILRLIDRGRQG
jgi:hypothetical protein